VTAARTLAVLAAVLALAGCGKSKEEKAFEELGRQCNALPGEAKTLHDAEILFRYPDYFSGVICDVPLTSMGPGDLCGAASDTNPICAADISFYPNDTSGICGPTGCWLGCEIRMKKADFEANLGTATICAARWFDENPTPQSF
jgi:hypothetical protein